MIFSCFHEYLTAIYSRDISCIPQQDFIIGSVPILIAQNE